MERLKILYRDRHLIAVHKPAGYVVYRDSPQDKAPGCKEILREQLGKPVFPVHRIDKDTCGALVFAIDKETAADLIKAFAGKRVSKRYLAVVHGQLPAQGVIRTPLPKHKVKGETESARTDFENLGSVAVGEWTYTVVRAEPKTGRYHQIRRHLAGEGHPIIGDTTYSKLKWDQAFEEKFGKTPMLLCAESVELEHPRNGKRLSIQTRPDGDFEKKLAKLRSLLA